MDKTLALTEFVLYRQDGDARQALFSDPDLDLVRAHKVDETRAALAAGKARPVLFVTRRDCVYPVGASGAPMAAGSTCDETEVAL